MSIVTRTLDFLMPSRRSADERLVEPRPSVEPENPYERFARTVPPALLATTQVTDRIYSRLSPDEIALVEGALSEEDKSVISTAPHNRKRFMLSYAVHHKVREALLKAALTHELPPEGVHSMSRGPLVIAGSCYYADLIVDALGPAGFALPAGARALDFGCSSGRVVRILAAAYPEVQWHGCDPIPGSIKWAREHLPHISFEVSQSNPPLPYEDGAFNLVFAVSIWSHFAENAATRWLEEMRRIIRPGGHLVLTTQGYQSIAYMAEGQLYEAETLCSIERALYTRGFWFAPVFGDNGDWGHVDSEWGMAFLSPEWLLAHVCADWKVVNFALGRVESNHDIFTLERR